MITLQSTDLRLLLLRHWVGAILNNIHFELTPLAGDASFRRYFRVITEKARYIAMDAPPHVENCKPFVAIATALQQLSVRVPDIHAQDLEAGFLLLTDFGDQQLLPILNHDSADTFYRTAMDELSVIQRCALVENDALPHFDDAQYWREFDIFFTWYLQKNQQKNLFVDAKAELEKYYQLLIDAAHAQPSVFVHRDYHSRNLMLCEDGKLGVLDFQDALTGPITYDLVSLLRDCYIAWPQAQVEAWVRYFYEKVSPKNCDFSDFLRWFDWMGLQRHLKCLGIFSRLYYRDQKNGYLKDIPRVLNYALMVCERYEELRGLRECLI